MNYNMILLIVVIQIIILISFVSSQIQTQKNNKYKTLYEYNHKNSRMYLDELRNMIKTTCSYKIDILLSKKFRVKLGSDDIDITTDEFENLNSEICMDIINQMSDHMKIYLYNSFGQEWIHTFIKSNVTYEIISFSSKL